MRCNTVHRSIIINPIYYFFLLLILISCNVKKKGITVYHKFEKHTWNRFENLRFRIPVEEVGKPMDIYFFAAHTKEYQFDNLDFGVIMNTPSGEERINQYNFVIRKKFGGFVGNCDQDSCVATIAIKKGIILSQPGILSIEIENLVPRLAVTELFGVGIKLVPVE
jgi:gliding motility-associated lipoprotein GldH